MTGTSLTDAAPLLSAVALLVSILGWRLLHQQLQGQRREDHSLREQVRRLHEAMHASADGLFVLQAMRDEHGVITDFRITDVNGIGASLLRRSADTLTGRSLRGDLASPFAEQLFERYVWALSTGSPIVEDVRVHRQHLAARWVLHQAMPMSDGLAVTVRDISQRKREERTLRRASLTDDLTGLYNRRGFMALADQQLRMARRNGRDCVVLYADMDGFKQLNDDHGHAVGDKALILVGRLLRETVRDCDVVARLGGDEFTILACDADGTGARIIQKRIEERLAVANSSGELPAPLQLTIGYTRVRPSDHSSVTELLARADQLLYARKRRRHLTRLHGTPTVTTETHAARPRGPRRTPRVAPVAVPADVAAVAIAAARNLPVRTPVADPMPMVPPLRLHVSS
ncbi:MAG: GGDEF domain-containing protein [Gemmatimonadaceae bacterium]|nr:GGDEF domain-containing protein [Gemmatimonadaceae bacterium]